MAERRMLCKTIIESDMFSSLPPDAQMLYVRLNLAADDDGFVSNPRSIMRLCGASDDSMKLLLAKKYVLTFEVGDDFIFLIRHWKMHNYIQKDRYRASVFKNLLREVYYDENKAYSLAPGDGHVRCLPAEGPSDALYTDCIQDVSKPDTQDRLGKDSLEKDKDRSDKSSTEEGDRKGRAEAERIRHFRTRADFFRRQGWDASSVYALAAREGITKGMIDGTDGYG
ncbi:MAG: replisome organizer [Oscillospiraceae bacterium]|nr:replisome organizer [Oscillospiraceae bacterium]